MRLRVLWWLIAAIALAFSPLARKGAAGPPQESKTKNPAAGLAGVWFMHGKVEPNYIEPEDAPFTPWGAERFKANRQRNSLDFFCFPAGVPKIWQIPAPFEIIPLSGRILILYESQHLVRQIHTNRKEHPKDYIPTWQGDSIGRWDGGTLVIDTTGFNEQTDVDIWGLPHSDSLHVVERIRLISHDLLEMEATIDDPKAYTKQWSARRTYDRKPGWEIGEEICEENNDYLIQNPH
jgi:hypothetical protein